MTTNCLFQFTPLREGRRSAASGLRGSGTFQFTPLREGRHRPAGKLLRHRSDFNSRPSARGDGGQNDNRRRRERISIHAPPRGATRVGEAGRWHEWLFQFTPLREGRLRIIEFLAGLTYFNSRPSARGDRFDANVLTILSLISIHAPPRGATAGKPQKWEQAHFNSRPSARGDALLLRFILALRISIHAPPRGATKHLKNFFAYYLISIHAPPRGATGERSAESVRNRDFNSRPSARGDRMGFKAFITSSNFNSRPSARGDLSPLQRF